MDIVASLGRALLYLGILAIPAGIYLLWKWDKYCRDYIKVLMIKADGSSGPIYVKKSSSTSVVIKNKDGTGKLWALSELGCVDDLYPNMGIIPKWLQRPIKMTGLYEENMEPFINRSPHLDRVASPDVIDYLKQWFQLYGGDKGGAMQKYLATLSTTPTRKVIASPAVLYNLLYEKVTEAVITVNKEMLESINQLARRIGKPISPTVFYVGVGAIIILQVFTIWQVLPALKGLGSSAVDIALIKQSLGIP